VRAVVMAYQDIGYVCLDALLELGVEVGAVVTHADDAGEDIWFRSVAERARRANIPVLVTESVNAPAVVARLRQMAPEFLFSFYFRQILSAEILGIPTRGALNLHGSLLPRYRGRCPVNWALVNGESKTGATLHYMERKADTGDIVAQHEVPIADDDTALTLNRKLGEAARALLRETIPQLAAGTAPRLPQDHAAATYFGGRRPEDGRMTWSATALQLYNLIRAVTHPYPGAFTTWRGERLFVWWATPAPRATPSVPGTVLAVGDGVVVATGDGTLRLRQVQVASGPDERAEVFARRVGLEVGDQLGLGDA